MALSIAVTLFLAVCFLGSILVLKLGAKRDGVSFFGFIYAIFCSWRARSRSGDGAPSSWPPRPPSLRSGDASPANQLGRIVNDAATAGIIDHRVSEIAARALEFGELSVGAVMVPRKEVIAIARHTAIDEVHRVFVESGHARLPVFENDLDDVIGYILAKDLLALMHDRILFVIEDIVRPAPLVPSSARAIDLLKQLQRERVHLALVVSEHGGVVGMVTMEDLLEELVGDIFSENEKTVPPDIEPQADGSLLVSGTTPVRELNRKCDLDLSDGDHWSTVAGLCMAAIGRMPRPGEIVTTNDGTTFEIIDASPRHIKLVRVRCSARASASPEV